MANLGVTLAHAGKRVLLVDADLRKPRLHEFFGISGDEGLATALQGASAADLVHAVDGCDNLAVLPAGGALANRPSTWGRIGRPRSSPPSTASPT